jgi:hypothetical protein
VKLQREKLKENFRLAIPVDVRQQIAQYGRKIFGNGLFFHEISFKTSDIKMTDIEKLAINIRSGIPHITEETYVKDLSYLEDLMVTNYTDKLRPYDPEEGCLITNLSKLPTHKLDFGSGKPEFIFLLTVGKNSTAILANRDHFILRYVY